MPATFLVVPVWQGSNSARALQLVDGAEAIRGDLPASATRTIEVPPGAGDALGSGVKRLTAVRTVRERIERELREVSGPAIVVGGDCGASPGAVAHAARAHGPHLGMLWLDAHADLHTPDTSPSGAFGGMALRAVLGHGADGLALDEGCAVPAANVVLGGARDLDDAEVVALRESGITSIGVAGISRHEEVLDAFASAGVDRVYVHIDLDVLDPATFAGVADAVPFGASPADVADLLRAVLARHPLAGATIAGFAPADAVTAGDDLPTILRLIGALTS
ncbi:arginase family protein [Agromyces mangrovi Wang et al. 2018]|uniref:arginase family protein n=1 Tax=Agromyces mangrovi TaxID=1858653 RepID=UPI0025731748|nr:arginase family protein [Agromyces mangrovi]BDZ65874.1 arginase [Agromyces mangrovi]